MRPILLIFCLLAPASAFAKGDTAREALGHLDRGMTLYDLGNYEKALEEFLAAKSLVPEKANPYRWLGLTNVRLGKCADAVPNLDSFLKMVQAGDPRAAEAIEERDRCRAKIAGTGVVTIQSTPSGAEVRIDRKEGPAAGQTPFRTDKVLLGERKVYVTLAGHQPGAALVTVGQSEQVINFVLNSKGGEGGGGSGGSVVPWIVAAVVAVAAIGAGIGIGVVVGAPRPEPTFSSITVGK